MRFSNEENLLASGSRSGAVKICDLESQKSKRKKVFIKSHRMFGYFQLFILVVIKRVFDRLNIFHPATTSWQQLLLMVQPRSVEEAKAYGFI